MISPIHIPDNFPVNPALSANDFYQYVYCPRKLYFLKMQFPKVPRMKMLFSEQRHSSLSPEDFPIPPTHFSYPAYSKKVNISAIIDAIRFHKQIAIPMEYKLSDFEVLAAWKAQLYATTLILILNGYTVPHGYVVTPKKHIKVPLGVQAAYAALSLAKRMRRLLSAEMIPPPVPSEKCGYCEMRKFCVR